MISQRYKRLNYITDLINTENITYKNFGKFKTSGVSGFVGKLNILDKKENEKKDDKNTIVYKMSSDVDFLIDHESFVLSQLNKLKIPHFVKYYDMVNSINVLEMNKTNKSKILLMEHLYSNYQSECKTFYNILNDNKDIGSKGRNIIGSQILQILMALEISQNELSFTHYDLHMDNVLELECEPNSLFLYEVNNTYYVVPTFGYYPVIIDVGMSYIHDVNDRPMYSATHNYMNGSQCAIFDTFNDIHHLLISSFYYIEDCYHEYEKISSKLKNIFANVPVLRKRGWKQLKNDLIEKTVNKTKEESKIFNDPIYDEQHNDVIGLLAALIILPLKLDDNVAEKENNKFDFENFLKEIKYIHGLYDIEEGDKELLLNIIKIAIISINKNEDKEIFYERLKEIAEDFDVELETKKLEFIKFNDLYCDGKSVGIQLSDYFYKLVIENTNIIQSGYKSIEDKYKIGSVIDFFNYFYENLTPNFKIDEDTIVYYFNSSTPKNINCKKLSKDQLAQLNKCSYLSKGVLLNKLLDCY